MSNQDWDQDDLLNFSYDRPRPLEISNRDGKRERDEVFEIPRQDEMRKAAQEAAYLKYRQEQAQKEKKNFDKSMRATSKAAKAAKAASKVTGPGSKFYKFTKVYSIPYVILFAAFTIIMTIMDVLPFLMMVALYIVLGLLSFIIVIQLTKDNVKKWAKVVSTVLASILIIFYSVGSAYALGTLSFLDNTSIVNLSGVSKITKEPFNVLITGMDVWGKVNEQGRSDVNMVVTVNPETETILMTSIPRDYQVRLPDKGYATDKLTHSGFYSVDTTIQAVEDLLQTDMNYYVKVNFTTIVKFIDAIGGLDFYNEQEFHSAIAKYEYPQGNIHVSGRGALYYARERKAFLAGDNQRVKNQQLIFSEMLKKATSSGTMLVSYNKVLSSLKDYFEMSFSSRELRSLVKMQLSRRIKWKMYKNTLSGSGASEGTYTTGATKVYVTAQDPMSVAHAQELITAVFNGQRLVKGENGEVSVVVGEE